MQPKLWRSLLTPFSLFSDPPSAPPFFSLRPLPPPPLSPRLVLQRLKAVLQSQWHKFGAAGGGAADRYKMAVSDTGVVICVLPFHITRQFRRFPSGVSEPLSGQSIKSTGRSGLFAVVVPRTRSRAIPLCLVRKRSVSWISFHSFI